MKFPRFGDRPIYYILRGHEPVTCDDVIEFGEFYLVPSNRRVALDFVASDAGECVEISTVFLAIDAAWSGPPLLFETMIFGGLRDGWRTTYHTWNEAAAAHKLIVQLVKTVEVLDAESESAQYAARELARIRGRR